MVSNMRLSQKNKTKQSCPAIYYLELLDRPWGDGGSLFTVGLCLMTDDFWSTKALLFPTEGRNERHHWHSPGAHIIVSLGCHNPHPYSGRSGLGGNRTAHTGRK